MKTFWATVSNGITYAGSFTCQVFNTNGVIDQGMDHVPVLFSNLSFRKSKVVTICFLKRQMPPGSFQRPVVRWRPSKKECEVPKTDKVNLRGHLAQCPG